MKPTIRPLNANPAVRAGAFTPPPTAQVTIQAMARERISYWKTIRIAWLSGYQINWVIPGRGGSVSGSKSVWNLDVRIQPEETIIPARTARWTIEPYVLQAGRPHIEPPLGTRLTISATATTTVIGPRSVEVQEAPTDLGETARWLPVPGSYSGGVWSPTAPPVAPDDAIQWTASESNLPFLDNEFTYAKRGQWITTTSMSVPHSSHFRLDGMPWSSTGVPFTLILVAAITAPTKYWASLLRAVEADGSTPLNLTNLDFRLMPDGNIHPFTGGWQQPLPLLSDSHTLSLFGFTWTPLENQLRMFTIDRTLQMAEMGLYWSHSDTSKFLMGRSAEAVYGLDLLDVLFYRGPMDEDQIMHIANELDAAYGITANPSEEQG